MRWLPAVIACLSVAPSVARAHSRLTEPPGRSLDDSLTEAPCGGVPAGEPVTIDAGSTIDLRWVATQSHANVYRVALSADGVSGFDENVIGTVPDIGAMTYTQAVPMPDCTCEACAIQLAQLTVTGNAAYYSCADVRLVGDAPPCAATTGDDSTDDGGDTSGDAQTTSSGGDSLMTGDASSGPQPAVTTGTSGVVEPQSSAPAGCGCASGDAGGALLGLGFLGLAAAMRRRARATTTRRCLK